MILHLPISSTSIGGTRQFLAQISSMNAILMGYWVAVQLSTMRSGVMYKSKFIIGDMTLMRFLMIQCEMFLRDHLRSTSGIYLVGSGRVRSDGCVDAI